MSFQLFMMTAILASGWIMTSVAEASPLNTGGRFPNCAVVRTILSRNTATLRESESCKDVRQAFARAHRLVLNNCDTSREPSLQEYLQGDLNCDLHRSSLGEVVALAAALPQSTVLRTNVEEGIRSLRENVNEKLRPCLLNADGVELSEDAARKVIDELKLELFGEEQREPTSVRETRRGTREATSRSRRRAQRGGASELGIPTLSPVAGTLLAAGIGGLAWRLRGQDNTGSTQLNRVLFGMLPYAAMGYLGGGWRGALMGASLGIPNFLLGWGNCFDIGRNRGPGQHSRVRDTWCMTGRGVIQTSLTAGLGYALGYNPVPLMMAGAAMGPCYSIAWSDRARTLTPPTPRGLNDGPTSVGEMCTGAAMGAGLMATMYMGRNEGGMGSFLQW